ncbi:MAG: hypothetical protein DMG06_18200 [Acidobacteria bacterium]|nr:MAG: hypothetical protein DMG06_18200 [Acidobacteriota bacterium]
MPAKSKPPKHQECKEDRQATKHKAQLRALSSLSAVVSVSSSRGLRIENRSSKIARFDPRSSILSSIFDLCASVSLRDPILLLLKGVALETPLKIRNLSPDRQGGADPAPLPYGRGSVFFRLCAPAKPAWMARENPPFKIYKGRVGGCSAFQCHAQHRTSPSTPF